jgi:hypothetical protein
MITRQSFVFQWNSAFSAKAPLRLLTEAEADPGQQHLRYAEQRPAGGERAHRHRAERGAEHDRQRGHPERQPEEPDADDADEDGRELHVRRHPRPELLQRLTVPLTERDELGSAGLYRRYLGTVGAFTDVGLDERGCRRTTGFGHLLCPSVRCERLHVSRAGGRIDLSAGDLGLAVLVNRAHQIGRLRPKSKFGS